MSWWCRDYSKIHILPCMCTASSPSLHSWFISRIIDDYNQQGRVVLRIIDDYNQ